MSDQVIAFPGTVDEAPMLGIDPPITCLHSRIEYSVRARTVRCRQCNELVDPFDAPVAYAEREAARLRIEADYRERKRLAAERHATRRKAKAAAEQLAGPPVLPAEEVQRRLAELRKRFV